MIFAKITLWEQTIDLVKAGESMQNKTVMGKRLQCIECGKKFYDLNKKNASCPKCGGEATDPKQVKPSLPKHVYLKTENDDPETPDNNDIDVISLDDMEESYSDLDLDELE